MFAIDLDGTLVWSEPVIVRALERRLGMSLEERNKSRYEDFGISAIIPPEEYKEALEEVLASPEAYEGAVPYPGAVEVVTWLERRQLLRGYVTARPPAVAQATQAWLRAWGLPPKPVIHDGGDRARALLELRAEVLVDDAPRVVSLAERWVVFLVDRPYNREAAHPFLIRVGGWEALGQMLRRLPLDVRVRRDPLGWPEKKKEGRRG